MTSTEGDDERPLPLTKLLLLSVVAICSEAAPFVCISVETAFLSRRQGSAAIAAFSAVQSACQFATGLFNFLILVVMNHTAKAIGAQAWQAVRQRVALAVAAALVCGAVCVGLLMLLKEPILELLDLEEDCRAFASSYFTIRALTTPPLLLMRVVTGTLSGLQWLHLATILNISSAIVEAVASYLALYVMESGLDGLGWASFGCSFATAAGGLVCVAMLLPRKVAGAAIAVADGADSLLAEEKPEEVPVEAPAFQPIQFLRDSADMMIRSLFLQSSVWALSICAARLGKDILAAHHVCMLLWMLTSYIIDGYADVGLMLGAKYLGAQRYDLWRGLCQTLALLGVGTGAVCGMLMWVLRDSIITLLLSSSSDATQDALHSVWWLISLMQVTNSIVFTYDGLLAAASQFAFVRNAISFGVVVLFAPTLAAGQYVYRTLLAVWVAKSVLNLWRFASSVVRINICLWPQWKETDVARDPEG